MLSKRTVFGPKLLVCNEETVSIERNVDGTIPFDEFTLNQDDGSDSSDKIVSGSAAVNNGNLVFDVSPLSQTDSAGGDVAVHKSRVAATAIVPIVHQAELESMSPFVPALEKLHPLAHLPTLESQGWLLSGSPALALASRNDPLL